MEQNLTFDQLPKAVTMLTNEISELKRLVLEISDQQITDKTDRLFTVQEAAQLLHLSVPTLYSKHSKRELPGVCKKGKRLYFSQQKLIEWVKEGIQESSVEIKVEAESYLKKRGETNGK